LSGNDVGTIDAKVFEKIDDAVFDRALRCLHHAPPSLTLVLS